jgi:hypothetical protein
MIDYTAISKEIIDLVSDGLSEEDLADYLVFVFDTPIKNTRWIESIEMKHNGLIVNTNYEWTTDI